MANRHPQDDQTLSREAQGFSFALEKIEARLYLRALHRPDYGAICADWLSSDVQRRIAGGRKQLLARAVGLNKTPLPDILDATAGLGRDGYTLAALGATVTMAERHPQIAALLQDAHHRALLNTQTAAIAQRVHLTRHDALTAFSSGAWDVVYLDPMYPHTGKTALPQKEMQIFRDLTNGDPDADALLQPALTCARKRVVVKRPSKAPWLAGRQPSLELRGTQARYDIYLKPSE